MPPHPRTRSQGKSTQEANKEDEHDSPDQASQLVAVRAELALLQKQYDTLLADRNRLAQTLNLNMTKWKRFKQWIFKETVKVPPNTKAMDNKVQVEQRASSSTPLQSHAPIKMLDTPVTTKKPRPTRSAANRSPTKSASPRRSPLSPNRHILNTPRKARTPSSQGSPSRHHLKRRRDENEFTEDDMSQTQEDSQALSFWNPSTPSQCSARKLSLTPCPPTPQHQHPPASLQSPPPTKRPRRETEPTPASPSVLAPLLPVASRYKRARASSPQALNAEFEIDPAANAGLPFAYDEVVRGQRHRHALNAGDCEECRDWYAAVGPLPPRLEAPKWRSPPPLRLSSSSSTLVSSGLMSNDHDDHDDACNGGGSGKGLLEDASTAAGINAHRQAVSRHRAQWERACTPPGYWDIGFPDTQAVDRINQQAAEIHRRKRAAVEKEVREGGGRYRKRA